MIIIRSYSKICCVILIGLLTIVFLTSCEKAVTATYPDYTGEKGIIYDIEGNEYKTIGIGTQIWMAENLRSTRFNDSTKIEYLIDSLNWVSTSYPGYCWYNNDTLHKIPYGGLYNSYTIITNKLCPTGWHIPSEEEWSVLIDELGGTGVAGGKLKVIGIDYWDYPNKNATNSACFNAVPGGGIFYGQFLSFGEHCYWWSTTLPDEESVSSITLSFRNPYVFIDVSEINHSGFTTI